MIQQLIITTYPNFKEGGIKLNFPDELIIIQIVFHNSFSNKTDKKANLHSVGLEK